MKKRGRKPQYDEDIRLLTEQGKTRNEIAKALGISIDTVKDARARMKLPPLNEINPEELVQRMLNKLHPEWEYVGGYTGSESRVDIRCRTCGYIKNVSYVTVRHPKAIVCDPCAQLRRKERDEKRSRIQKIVREFNRPVKKKEQIQMKTCPDCGAFYYSTKAICKDCAIARQKRVANRKKDLKKKGSHTKESKLISARTLYKRDGGICWICGGMCDINADPNSDLYPSVDHIVPQSLGGKDTLDNVRLAHRICNTRRSNRADFQNLQTFLIPPVS